MGMDIDAYAERWVGDRWEHVPFPYAKRQWDPEFDGYSRQCYTTREKIFHYLLGARFDRYSEELVINYPAYVPGFPEDVSTPIIEDLAQSEPGYYPGSITLRALLEYDWMQPSPLLQWVSLSARELYHYTDGPQFRPYFDFRFPGREAGYDLHEVGSTLKDDIEAEWEELRAAILAVPQEVLRQFWPREAPTPPEAAHLDTLWGRVPIPSPTFACAETFLSQTLPFLISITADMQHTEHTRLVYWFDQARWGTPRLVVDEKTGRPEMV